MVEILGIDVEIEYNGKSIKIAIDDDEDIRYDADGFGEGNGSFIRINLDWQKIALQSLEQIYDTQTQSPPEYNNDNEMNNE